MFATTGDYLRLWTVQPEEEAEDQGEAETTVGKADKSDNKHNLKVALKGCLNNNKMSDFCAPLTSFDWNIDNPNILGTSSIDTTVSIWDIETQLPTTQLIAHDKDVFDMAFSKGTNGTTWTRVTSPRSRTRAKRL
jgi:DDB1- and CUL4-associated factor 7